MQSHFDPMRIMGTVIVIGSLVLSIIFLLILGNVFGKIIYDIFFYIFYGGIDW